MLRLHMILFLMMLIGTPTVARADVPADAPAPLEPFGIHLVDDATERGVPLVELRTTSNISYWTDSAGWVAFDEPGLLGEEVYFSIASDGYEYPADGFGYRGARLRTFPGGEAELRLHRINTAERLYRLTGHGIYRDSVLLRKPAPIEEPLLNALVVGQDSTQAVVWKDRVLWIWGDTSRVAYPLGHFGAAGAVSELPAAGGLPIGRGVDFHYFTDDSGFSRPTVDGPEKGAKWLDGLMILPDDHGNERLVARCARMENLGKMLEQTLVAWDDTAALWRRLAPFDQSHPLAPVGHPFRVMVEGTPYFYFPAPYPNARVRAEWSAIQDPTAYEGYTCLVPGSEWDGATSPTVERDAAGAVVWGWKRNTASINGVRERELLKQGALSEEERWLDMRDVETSANVLLWGGSVAWNEFRQSYIMIANQGLGAPSPFGEIWFAEAPAPEGPWRQARRIVTHAKHSFYNPVHHPFFDEEGGRIIYFEGTYVDTFSDADPTPRYNYNQILYRLDLADERLSRTEALESAAE